MKTKYGFGKKVSYTFEVAIETVKKELEKEGFGVLSEIDVSATMKKKLDRDMPPYKILGACNPQFAHITLEAEPSIGLLLPCNVVVRQDAQNQVHVEFMDPYAVLDLVENKEVSAVATEVRTRLQKVMAALL
jgi:uncharacterized protein (DUF302 family)